MRRHRRAVAVVVAGLMAAPLLAADHVVVKLATLVPDGSVWDKELRTMGAEWQEATEGRVSLRIYPGGVAGDEPDIVRKMRIGQLHAAALTVTGLTEIDDALKVFEIPLLFDSYEELFWVLERTAPTLERRLADNGFVLLNWGHAGWVHFFSKRPVRRVEDLKRQKIFTWAGNDEMVQWWKENGFQPVALAVTDVLTGLQTGMIEAYPTTPLAALSLQWFRQTPYMVDLGLAPLVGAVVVTERAWQRIPEGDRRLLLTAAQQVEERLERDIPQQDDKAVKEMKKRGLTVTETENPSEWTQAAERFLRSTRDSLDQDILDRVLAARSAFRQRHGSGESN